MIERIEDEAGTSDGDYAVFDAAARLIYQAERELSEAIGERNKMRKENEKLLSESMRAKTKAWLREMAAFNEWWYMYGKGLQPMTLGSSRENQWMDLCSVAFRAGIEFRERTKEAKS